MHTIRRRSAAHIALAALVFSGGALTLAACDPLPPCSRNWTGATDSDFGTPSNWAENAAPTATDRACAPTGSTIVVNGTHTVESMLLDGSVTIPAGSSLSNVSPAQTISLIDTLTMQGALGGDSAMLVREGHVTSGTFDGSSFVAFLGTHNSTVISNMSVNGTKAVLLGNQTLWAGGARLCDSAAVGIVGDVWNNGLSINSTGCETVTNPRFGIAESGTFHVTQSGVNASAIDVINAGTLKFDGLASFRARSLTQISGSTEIPISTLNLAGGTFDVQGGTLSGGSGRITGNLTVGNATVLLDGSQNRGLIVTGNLTTAAGSVVRQHLTADDFPNPWKGGNIRVNGLTQLGGALEVTAADGFTPEPGYTNSFLTSTYASDPPVISGTFSPVTLPSVPGRTPALAYLDYSVDLVIP